MDNSVTQELDKTILWQYDNAENLIAIIDMMKEFHVESTQKLWDSWPSDVVDIDTASDFGLAIWGNLLGVPRFILDNGDGTTTVISTDLYRSILKARAILLNGNASIPDYCDYVHAIFGDAVSVEDGLDMSLMFYDNGLDGEKRLLFEQYLEDVMLYPTGVHDNDLSDSNVFALDGQQTNLTSSDPHAGGLDESSFAWRNY